MADKPVPLTSLQLQKLMGAAIHFKRLGDGKIVGWSGHTPPWPLVRLDRDPPYFGSLLCADRVSLLAAAHAAGINVGAAR